MRHRHTAILTYHSIDNSGSVISVSPERFRAQMKLLAASGVRVVPFAEIQRHPGAVALTFDDGFGNFYQHAFPVLQDYGWPATVFVVSGYCGRRNDWPSQPAAGIPLLELMDWQQIREIARFGIALGAHTVNHPRLTALSEARRDAEFRESKMEIEDRTGRAIDTLAYPYGDYDFSVCRQAAGYFRMACTTELRYADGASDPLALPRLDVYYLQNLFWFRHSLRPVGGTYLAMRRALRSARNRRFQRS